MPDFVNNAPLFYNQNERIALESLGQRVCGMLSAAHLFCANNTAEYELSDVVILHAYMILSARCDGAR